MGQRLDSLSAALAELKIPAEKSARITDALNRYRSGYEQLRPLLCHGISKVTLDRSGNWVAIFRLLSIRKKQADRAERAFEQQEAGQVIDDLQRLVQRLEAVLADLRSAGASRKAGRAA
jgi:hypothetical protein